VPANTHGQYFDLDFLRGFCLLGLGGSKAGAAERGSRFLVSVLPLALGFLATPEEATFFGVGFLVVRVLLLTVPFSRTSLSP